MPLRNTILAIGLLTYSYLVNFQDNTPGYFLRHYVVDVRLTDHKSLEMGVLFDLTNSRSKPTLNNLIYFLVTGSLFDAKYRGSDGVLRNTDFNGEYAFNALFAKEILFRRSSLSLGAKFTATGGRWYGPVDEVASRQNQEIIFASVTRNSLQFAPYRRFDVKIDYRINRRRLSIRLLLI